MLKSSSILIALLLLTITTVVADDSGRIYGKITTDRGDILEGFIRWDKNEGSWVDLLNGSKELGDDESRDDRRGKRRKYGSRRGSVKLFGVRIGERSDYYGSAQSGIRFGHIASMTVLDDDRVLLKLKSGEEVEMFDGSTDIGSGIREIVIEDRREGELELVWDNIEMIEFMQAPGGLEPSVFGERLYGTLTTRQGDKYTGEVCWDVDEIFSSDVLDGEVKGRSRKIRFGRIAAIERYSSKGATVILKSGDELVMRGTNDVNSSNKGILIADPGLGQINVSWNQFERLEFTEAPASIKYATFDGGRPIIGTVQTEDGDEFTGKIRWDRDEEYTWEILDGEYGRSEFDIEFGFIKSIQKKSRRGGTEVTLVDGRTLRLRNSNDVDSDNKGIYVRLDDGDVVRVDWEDFSRVEFSH